MTDTTRSPLVKDRAAVEIPPTAGPWFYAHRKKPNGMYDTQVFDGVDETIADIAWYPVQIDARTTGTARDANARLIAASPDMLAALRNVQKLISEAAMTGFNYKDGDWVERLFASQQVTSAAIKKATGRHK